MKKTILAKTLIASAITFSIGTVAAAPYDIIDLGKIEGGTNSFAYGLNNTGEVVGFGNGPLITNDNGQEVPEFDRHAIQFMNGSIVDLGTLVNGSSSLALAINNNGTIIGTSSETRTVTNSDGVEIEVTENFASTFQGGMVSKLNDLADFTFTEGLSINDNEIAVGVGFIDVDPDDDVTAIQRGYIYNVATDTRISNVSALSDGVGRQSYPLSINNNGLVAGWAEKDVDGIIEARAFWLDISQPDVLNELPTLNTIITIARDINDSGIVVGLAQNTPSRARNASFLYNINNDSELTILPYLDSRFEDSVANAINNNGQIVGQALVSAPSIGQRAAYLFENDETKNLNSLISCETGWFLDNATNINDNGEIVGYGLKTETVANETITEVRAFKLIPTGGAIDVCEDDSDNDSGNSGGSWNFVSMMLLGLVLFRRKYML